MIETLNSNTTIQLGRQKILPGSDLNSFIQYMDNNPQVLKNVISKNVPSLQVPPIPRQRVLQLFQNEKVLLADPTLLNGSIDNLFNLLNISQNSSCEIGDILEMKAYLSQALWNKGGNVEQSNSLLIHSIQESSNFLLYEKWFEWTRWLAVRYINMGNFKEARELLEPIVNKLSKEYKDLPKARKASFLNNYALAIMGEKKLENYNSAEYYFKLAIDLDPLQPIYIHNLSDLYKRFYIDFGDKFCLDLAKKNAEYLYVYHLNNQQHSLNYRDIAPVSRVLFLNNFAEIYYLYEDYDNAINILSQAFKESNSNNLLNEPCFARLYETEAKILYKQGKLKESKESIIAAIKIGKEKMKNSHFLKKFEEMDKQIDSDIVQSEIFLFNEEEQILDIQHSHSFIEGLEITNDETIELDINTIFDESNYN